MAYSKTIIEKISMTERKLSELNLQLKRFEDLYKDLLDLFETNKEDLRCFVENPKNYDSETWDLLKQEEKEIEERIHFEFENVSDPNKTTEIMAERGKVQQHWLFVR